MKEGIPYKLLHTNSNSNSKPNSKPKMIPTLLVTIITLLILATFIAMSSNVGQVEAKTVVDPNCGVIDQKPSGKCDVDIDYDGKCSPSSRNCNIDINVVTNPPPSGNNESKLNYLLETGIYCNNVTGFI